MRFTNQFGLPDAILKAARYRNDQYDAQADRSVTALINPPQIDVLRKAHFGELTKDISEEMFALLGSAMHKVLEWGEVKGLTEERLFARINDWTVSGQIDLQTDDNGECHINDYKVCAAYSITKNDEGQKWEWIAQLNLYAYLIWLNKGIRVSSISIIAIIRDWQRAMAVADTSYPQSPVWPIKLDLWSVERQEAYLRERVSLHQEAVFNHEVGLPLPECSHQERWAKPDKWAVTKRGNKRAKVFTDREEAEQLAAELGVEVETRPGQSTRCHGNYCGISQWCEQWKMACEISRRSEEQDPCEPCEDGLGEGEGDQEAVLSGGVDDPADFQEGRVPDQFENVDPQDTEEHNVEGAGNGNKEKRVAKKRRMVQGKTLK